MKIKIATLTDNFVHGEYKHLRNHVGVFVLNKIVTPAALDWSEEVPYMAARVSHGAEIFATVRGVSIESLVPRTR